MPSLPKPLSLWPDTKSTLLSRIFCREPMILIFDPLNLRNFIYIKHHFICLIFQKAPRGKFKYEVNLDDFSVCDITVSLY